VSYACYRLAAVLFEPAVGHIGMIAGRSSPEAIWQPVARWLLDLPAGPQAGATAKGRRAKRGTGPRPGQKARRTQ